MNVFLLKKSIIEKTSLTFARSGGNGGQNVNKVNTKVHCSLAVVDIEGLTEVEVKRLREKLSSIINGEDCIYLDCDEERTQERNREIALKKLEERIVNALKVNKKRIKTKPTKASRERRMKLKKVRSEIKKNRGRIL